MQAMPIPYIQSSNVNILNESHSPLSVPSNCLTLSKGPSHFDLNGVKISPCGLYLSKSWPKDPDCIMWKPLNPSASLSFHSVLEHVPQNEILKIGPWPESKTN